MKPKTFFGSFAAAATFFFFVAAGTGDAWKGESATTTEVSIDGTSFLSEESFSNDSTLLRRELARLGVHPPESFDIPESPRALGPVFSKKLAGSPKPISAAVPYVPAGMKVAHTLRMSGGNQAVELAIGKLESGAGPLSARLAAKGFVPVSMEENTRLPRMLQFVRGKETTVVWLDEAKDTFLLLRKLEK